MWVKFWVQGKSRQEKHLWLDDSCADEDIKCECEDWASQTSQGVLNDHYRYGWERVKKLPAKVKQQMIDDYKYKIKHAQTILKELEK